MRGLLLATLLSLRVYGQQPVLVANSPTFTEGPVFDAKGNFFFSHRDGVFKLSPTGDLTHWADDPTAGFHGHKVLPNGIHLVCAAKRGAIWKMDATGKKVGVASSECDGKPLRAPNDLTLDGHGGVYFTDPGGSREGPIGTVHYIDRKGRTTQVVGGLRVPNGVVLSPDERLVYVAETVPNRILRFPVLSPGKLGPMHILTVLPGKEGHDATPDGLAIDSKGNLYVAHLGTGSVFVLDPQGKLLHQWPGGNYDVSNLAFGGPGMSQLFLTGSIGFRSKTEGRVFRLDLPGVRGRR